MHSNNNIFESTKNNFQCVWRKQKYAHLINAIKIVLGLSKVKKILPYHFCKLSFIFQSDILIVLPCQMPRRDYCSIFFVSSVLFFNQIFLLFYLLNGFLSYHFWKFSFIFQSDILIVLPFERIFVRRLEKTGNRRRPSGCSSGKLSSPDCVSTFLKNPFRSWSKIKIKNNYFWLFKVKTCPKPEKLHKDTAIRR